MTFGDLKSRTFKRLDQPEDGTGFYTVAAVESALNYAQWLMALLTLGLEDVRTIDLDPDARFFHLLTLWPDFIRTLRVKLDVIPGSTDALVGAGLADAFMPNEGDLDATLVPAIPRLRTGRLQDLAAVDPAWLSATGVPTRYAFAGFDLLALDKTVPVIGLRLSITVARTPALMADDDDVPELPDAQHEVFIDFALFWLRAAEGGSEFLETLNGLGRFFADARQLADAMRQRAIAQRYDSQPPEWQAKDLSRLLRIRPDLDPGKGSASSPQTSAA